jgi:hypothetical protein
MSEGDGNTKRRLYFPSVIAHLRDETNSLELTMNLRNLHHTASPSCVTDATAQAVDHDVDLYH